jgi:hypothetical protein
MGYAHAQMMLYRPFIHYHVGKNKLKPVDKGAYVCAAAAIGVARNIIHIATEMKKQNLLNGAYWFSVYTSFFAIYALVYFAVNNQDNPTSYVYMKDAMEGRDMLSEIARSSLAADRCTATLKVSSIILLIIFSFFHGLNALQGLFERLPERLKHPQHHATMQHKKRRQDLPPNSGPASLPKGTVDPGLEDFNSPKRSHTFPDGLPPSQVKRMSFPPSAASGKVHTGLPIDSGYHGSPMFDAVDFDVSPGLTPASSTTSFSIPNRALNSLNGPDNSLPPTPLQGNFNSNNIMSQFHSPRIPDMSAMMFPSADPFAYPNQPMTTFEQMPNRGDNNTDIKHEKDDSGVYPDTNSLLNSPRHNSWIADANSTQQLHQQAMLAAAAPDAKYSPEDIQLYGTMPMYMMPHQTTGLQSQPEQQQQDLNYALIVQQQQMQQASQQMRQVSQQRMAGAAASRGALPTDEIWGGDSWGDAFMDQGFGFGIEHGN